MITQIPATKRTWNRVELGDICAQDKTTVLPNDPDAPALKYVGLEHVESGSGRILPSVGEDKPVRSGAYRFDSRHVLYGKLRPYLNKVALPDFSGRCTTELVPLLPAKSVDRDWLAWQLRRPETVDFAMRGKTGSRMPRANMREFMGMSISLPPLAEQKRIVARLNAQMAVVDRAKAAAREILDAAEALNAAIIRELMPYLGHQLADFWKWRKLGEICEIVSGATPKSGVEEYWNGNITWVTPTDLSRLDGIYIGSSQRMVTNQGYDSCSTNLVPKGSVVMSTRAPIGHLAIADTELCTNQGCKTFVPNPRVDSKFLYFALRANVGNIQMLGSGTTFTEVSKTKLANFDMPIPPISEQKRVVALLDERLAESAKIAAAARGGLDEVEAMPSALLRRALGDGG